MALTIPNVTPGMSYPAQTELDPVQLQAMVQSVAGTGVLTSCSTGVLSGMNLIVANGDVCVNGVRYSCLGDDPVALASDGTNPRWYIIYTDTTGIVTKIAGTPAADPLMPTLPANAVLLACIYVPASAASLSSTMILDGRVMLDRLVWPRPTTQIVTGSTVTANHNDVILVNALGFQVTLPSSLPTGSQVAVKMIASPAAAADWCLVYPTGSSIDGLSGGWYLTEQYESVSLTWDGTSWWTI